MEEMRASIKSTLLGFSVGVAVLPAAVMAGLILYMQQSIVSVASAKFETVAIDNTKQVASDMLGMCTLIQKSRDETVRRKRARFFTMLEPFGAPSLSKEKTEAEISSDADPALKTKRKIPILMFGDTRLNGGDGTEKITSALEALKEITRTDYAILVRLNESGDMLRVATTLTDSNGRSMLYSYVPAKRKSGGMRTLEIADLLQGKNFRGMVNIGGAYMRVSYEPIFDQNQNVIGAIFFGITQNFLDDLRTYMESVRIGEDGYVWAIEAEDVDKSVFRVSKDGKLNGFVMQFDEQNSRRKNFMEILEGAKKLSEGEIGVNIYAPNLSDGTDSKRRITCYAYFKPWNWVLGATAYTEDFERGAQFVDDQARAVLKKLLYGLGFVMFVTMLFVWYLISKLNSSFVTLKSIGESLSVGDIYEANQKIKAFSKSGMLSPIKETYEQFVSVGQMSKNLSELISQTQKCVVDLAGGASKITMGARELGAIIALQGASVREVSQAGKSIMNSSVKLNKDAKSSAQDVEKTLQLAVQSGKLLESLKINSDELIKSTNQIVSSLDFINRNAGGISSVISTINSLSEQTNLLSLNAAIEAEKAGEYGLGFSVVAREIRKLADQTATATKDIERMVEELQISVNSGVAEIDRFGARMREGSETIHFATVSLGKVVEEVSDLAPRFEELAREIGHQAEGAEEISRTMDEISKTSMNVGMRISEFKRATESLDAISAELKEEISLFKIKEASSK